MAVNIPPFPDCQLLDGGKYPKSAWLSPFKMAGNILHLPECQLSKWREIFFISPTVSCWNGGKYPTSSRLSAYEMAGNILPLPDCQLLKWRKISYLSPTVKDQQDRLLLLTGFLRFRKIHLGCQHLNETVSQHWTVWKGCSLVKNALVLLGTHGYFFWRSDHINQFFLCMRKWFSMSFKSFPIPYTIINFLFASLRLRTNSENAHWNPPQNSLLCDWSCSLVPTSQWLQGKCARIR